MLDIKIKDIRVLPSSLDLKNNANKSMSEILGQLQSGSVVKGLVVGTTPKEAIFHTAYGRFAAKNVINLVRGDTITLKLASGDKDLSGTIIAVNNKKQDTPESLKLNLSNARKQESITNKRANAVNVSNTGNIPKTIKGEISYLNLSKTNKNTPLFRALNSTITQEVTKIPISLNTVSSKQSSNSAFITLGEVAGNTKDGNQLIKTTFGVILSAKTSMPIGQKLNLEITSINNQSLTQTINKGIGDFLFSANKNWPLLKNLAQVTHGSRKTQVVSPTNTSKIVQNITTYQPSAASTPEQAQPTVSIIKTVNNKLAPIINTPTSVANKIPQSPLSNELITNKTPQATNLETRELLANVEKLQIGVTRPIRNRIQSTRSNNEAPSSKKTLAKISENHSISAPVEKEKVNINSLIRDLGKQEEIRKLSSELMNLKELILPPIKEGETPEKWQTIIIPFHNGKQVENHEVKIDRSRDHFLRFLIDVNLLDNPMQIDGLIRFENDNKTPSTFDLTVRSKKPLDSMIQSRIVDIYQINQSISGVYGNLSIE